MRCRPTPTPLRSGTATSSSAARPTRRRSRASAISTAAGVVGTIHYLGELGGTACVAITLADDAAEPQGLRRAGLRSLFFKLPEPLLALAGRAFQIVDWDRTHRYCGRCGTPTRDKPDERAQGVPALRARRLPARRRRR